HDALPIFGKGFKAKRALASTEDHFQFAVGAEAEKQGGPAVAPGVADAAEAQRVRGEVVERGHGMAGLVKERHGKAWRTRPRESRWVGRIRLYGGAGDFASGIPERRRHEEAVWIV